MSNVYELQPRFAKLFTGLPIAFGTGRGQWIRRPPRPEDWIEHLTGRGPGIGIGPLREDNTVLFAAIDLDEPDFDAARDMQRYIPGPSFIERSRSGNAHIWVFFSDPIEAWVPMGILKIATEAAGKPHVEVFPKNHDFARVDLGNYINLPYHGDQRPMLVWDGDEQGTKSLAYFLDEAEQTLNNPDDWRNKAQWLMVEPPQERKRTQEFGAQESLHVCAQHIISGDAGPISYGHRSVTYFNLAKQLTNWKHADHDEVVMMMRAVNAASAPDSIPDDELLRIINNAEEKQYTSTGCDDPVFAPYAHPDCPIANPRRK